MNPNAMILRAISPVMPPSHSATSNLATKPSLHVESEWRGVAGRKRWADKSIPLTEETLP
jgi:hypothetical protein